MPTKLLKEAFERASELPDDEQDRLGLLLRTETEQARFDALIESPASLVLLARLAAEARADEKAGMTEPGGFDGR